MNIQSARNVVEFVQVLKTDSEGRPYLFLVPGHQGRRYQVELERNGGLRATCKDITKKGQSCDGNLHAVCYHVLASCLIAAEVQGKELSWCESETDAERLARVGGETFSVASAQSGKSAWGVMRGGESDLKTAIATYERMADLLKQQPVELATVGLSKDELTRLAIDKTAGKQQWFSGETLWLAEDAYLANDSGFVRLYRITNPGARYPESKSLAIVFWLDPREGCWKRYTAHTAMSELFD